MDLEAVQLMTHTEEGASALIWSIAIYLYYVSYILECENVKAKVESKVVMTTGLLAAEMILSLIPTVALVILENTTSDILTSSSHRFIPETRTGTAERDAISCSVRVVRNQRKLQPAVCTARFVKRN